MNQKACNKIIKKRATKEKTRNRKANATKRPHKNRVLACSPLLVAAIVMSSTDRTKKPETRRTSLGNVLSSKARRQKRDRSKKTERNEEEDEDKRYKTDLIIVPSLPSIPWCLFPSSDDPNQQFQHDYPGNASDFVFRSIFAEFSHTSFDLVLLALSTVTVRPPAPSPLALALAFVCVCATKRLISRPAGHHARCRRPHGAV